MDRDHFLPKSSHWSPTCIIALATLLLLTGCIVPLGASSGQEGPVTVIANNSANSTHTFKVYVVEASLTNTSLTIQKSDGEVDSTVPGDGMSVYDFNEKAGNTSSVEPPANQSYLHEELVVQPGSEKRTNISEFETQDAIVVVISNQYRVVSLIASECSDDLVMVVAEITPYGGAGGHNCEL